MLSRQQWQWLADNYKKVRILCIVVFALGMSSYIGLVVKAGIDKGKAFTPYMADTNFTEKFECIGKVDAANMSSKGGASHPHPEYYEDSSGWRFERHYTFMYDSNLLFSAPECVGAMMADSSKSIDPFVIIIYDLKTRRPIYRIASKGR